MQSLLSGLATECLKFKHACRCLCKVPGKLSAATVTTWNASPDRMALMLCWWSVCVLAWQPARAVKEVPQTGYDVHAGGSIQEESRHLLKRASCPERRKQPEGDGELAVAPTWRLEDLLLEPLLIGVLRPAKRQGSMSLWEIRFSNSQTLPVAKISPNISKPFIHWWIQQEESVISLTWTWEGFTERSEDKTLYDVGTLCVYKGHQR